MNGKIIYEITAGVRADLVDFYERYMRERHIPDLLATGFFEAAELARAEVGRYRMRYVAADGASLESYLAREAARLRADFTEHFPEGVELSREIWQVVEEWK